MEFFKSYLFSASKSDRILERTDVNDSLVKDASSTFMQNARNLDLVESVREIPTRILESGQERRTPGSIPRNKMKFVEVLLPSKRKDDSSLNVTPIKKLKTPTNPILTSPDQRPFPPRRDSSPISPTNNFAQESSEASDNNDSPTKSDQNRSSNAENEPTGRYASISQANSSFHRHNTKSSSSPSHLPQIKESARIPSSIQEDIVGIEPIPSYGYGRKKHPNPKTIKHYGRAERDARGSQPGIGPTGLRPGEVDLNDPYNVPFVNVERPQFGEEHDAMIEQGIRRYGTSWVTIRNAYAAFEHFKSEQVKARARTLAKKYKKENEKRAEKGEEQKDLGVFQDLK